MAEFDQRTKQYQEWQKQWADQQVEEKVILKKLEKEVEDNYSRQTLELNVQR